MYEGALRSLFYRYLKRVSECPSLVTCDGMDHIQMATTSTLLVFKSCFFQLISQHHKQSSIIAGQILSLYFPVQNKLETNNNSKSGKQQQ